MARVGYARVSTSDQHPEAQRARLLQAGCDELLMYTDHGASGAKASRPQWDACRAALRAGDTLVVVKLDRVGRSVRNLIDVAADLEAKHVDLVVLDQGIDTTTAAGKLLFHVMAAIAEFERELIRERTRDGLAATKARGRNGGRKPRLTEDQKAQALKFRAVGYSITEIGVMLGNGKPVSKATVYRALGMTSDTKRDPAA